VYASATEWKTGVQSTRITIKAVLERFTVLAVFTPAGGAKIFLTNSVGLIYKQATFNRIANCSFALFTLTNHLFTNTLSVTTYIVLSTFVMIIAAVSIFIKICDENTVLTDLTLSV
jgi:hypothetical protein